MVLFRKATSLAVLSVLAIGAAKQITSPWITLAPLPAPRQEHSTVAVNDTTIAVVGGITPVNGTSVVTDSVQFYDIPSDTWCTVTPAPFKVNHPNVAVVDGKIYLLGGLVDGPSIAGLSINWIASGESHVYDPALGNWTALAPMPPGTERGSTIVGVHGDVIYLAGGMSLLQDIYQDSLTTVTAFNTTSGQWQRLPPAAAGIPEGRQHGTGSVVNDTFYVVGGRWFGQRNVRGTVFELDLTNQDAGWKTSASQMPVPRGGLSGGTVGSKIVTFGGEGNPNSYNGVFNNTEVFDTVTETWTEAVPMAVPRHGTSAVAIGNRVYIPGGGLQQDGLPVVVNGTTLYGQPSDHFDAYIVA